jgi:hypothetical protein
MLSISTLQKKTKSKAIISFLFLIILVPTPYAACDSDQIDINSAEKSELIKIVQIGESRAEQLIELRPFGNLDELTKIKGIGPVYLEQIKSQGLACIGEEEKEEEEEIEIEEEGEKEPESVEEPELEKGPVILETIHLETKTIKSQENTENKENKIAYLKYGFAIFCFLLGVLFILKKSTYGITEFR